MMIYCSNIDDGNEIYSEIMCDDDLCDVVKVNKKFTITVTVSVS